MADKKYSNEYLAGLLATHLYNGACHASQAATHVSDARGTGDFKAYMIQIEGAIGLAQNDLDAAKELLDSLKGG